MNENKQFKKYLVFQSFLPLFFLLFVKHFQLDFVYYVELFLENIFHRNWFVLYQATTSPFYGDVVVCIECLLWMAISIIVYFADKQKRETGNFQCEGKKVKIIEKKYDSGASYLMTFVLPLMLDDLSTVNGMITFYVMVSFVYVLVCNTNLFYANPVLFFLNYKVAVFSQEEKTFIGLFKGCLDEDKIVKMKYISDDVFFIANDG